VSEIKHELIYEVNAIPNVICDVLRSAKELDDDKYFTESNVKLKKK